MNFYLLHDLMFYALYGLATVGAYAIAERAIFFASSLREARRLAAVPSGELKVYAPVDGRRRVAGDMLESFIVQRPQLATRHEVEDVGEALFLAARQSLLRHLWIVDTLVTAAPLLGLLGTILGIIDTFQALAASGISDPGAVSRGIGTALFATALGIAIALAGLVANNWFQHQVERVGDLLKVILLKAGQGPVEAPVTSIHRASAGGR